MREPDFAWFTMGISTSTSYPHAPYARAMNRLRQYALPRQHGRSRRDLHTRDRRPATKYLIAAATVALTVLPLSACSDGGGKIIRSWLLKQDGVEKVKTSCQTYAETGCHAIATTTLSDDTEPNQACTFLNRVATELPRHDKLKESMAYIQLTWKHHGTVLVFEKLLINLSEEKESSSSDDQEQALEKACTFMETAAEHSGGTAEKITQEYDSLTIDRGTQTSIPSDISTRPIPAKDGQYLSAEDNFTIDNWSIRTSTSREKTTERLPTSLISDIVNLPIPEVKEPRIVITANTLISDEKEGFRALVGGLGPYNPDGPSQDTTDSLLSTIKKYPNVSHVSLCTELPKNEAKNCTDYSLKNGEFVEASS